MPLSARLLADITHAMRAAPAAMAAQEAAMIWQRLARKFIPLIGPSSVQLIIGRTIEANQSVFPWLGLFSSPGMSTPPYDGLRQALEQAGQDDIEAVTTAMLNTYTSQLTILIGGRLTEQFLHATFPATGAFNDPRSNPE